MPELRGYTTNASGDGSQVVVSRPGTAMAGDLLIIFVSVDKGSTADTSISPPSGWSTLVHNLTSVTEVTCSLYYKIAGASEPNGYTITYSLAGGEEERAVATCMAWYDHDGIDSVGTDVETSGTSTAVCPSITPTVNDTTLLRLVAADGGRDTVPHGTISGYTMLANFGEYSASSISIQHDDHASGATGTANVSLGASEEWCAITLAIAPGGIAASGTATVTSATDTPTLSTSTEIQPTGEVGVASATPGVVAPEVEIRSTGDVVVASAAGAVEILLPTLVAPSNLVATAVDQTHISVEWDWLINELVINSSGDNLLVSATAVLSINDEVT